MIVGSFRLEAGCDGLFTTSLPRGWGIYRRGVTPTHELLNFGTPGLPPLDSPLRYPASYVCLGQPTKVALLVST